MKVDYNSDTSGSLAAVGYGVFHDSARFGYFALDHSPSRMWPQQVMCHGMGGVSAYLPALPTDSPVLKYLPDWQFTLTHSVLFSSGAQGLFFLLYLIASDERKVSTTRV